MLKNSSSIIQGRPIGVMREYITDIHSLLISLLPSSEQTYNNLTNEQITQLNSIPQFSCFREVVEKCMQIHEVLFRIIVHQKDIVSRVVAMIQQIQYAALRINQNTKFHLFQKTIKSKVLQLKGSINELPFSHFQLNFGQKNNYHKNTQQGISKIKKQNSDLKEKLLKVESKANILQQKLKNLYDQTKIQQFVCTSKEEKFVERLCGRIFNQKLPMRANYQTRNQIECLSQQNKKLTIQLRKSKQLNRQLQEKYESQIISVNRKKLDQTREKQIPSVNISDWTHAITNLQRQIDSLRRQRKKQNKAVHKAKNRIQDVQMTQSIKNSSTVAPQNEYIKKRGQNIQLKIPEIEIYRIKSSQLTENDLEMKSYQSHGSPKWLKNQKRLKTENFENQHHVRSTLTLRQSPTHSSLAERYIKKFDKKRRQTIENEQQQLKNSGYFNQPEEMSNSSNGTNKCKSNNFHKRGVTEFQIKTQSTLC